MARKALDGTSTSSDFYTVFDNVVASNPQLNKVITEVRNESNLFLVRVLRFYTVRDMAYVEELDSGDKYYCHLTHEMLSYEVSLNCMCDGTVESDTNYGTYVKPFSRIYGIVADVRFKGNIDKKCLLGCLNYDDDNQLKSNVRNGEIKLVSGESTLSITRDRINLMTPRLFVNGLPFEEPKLANYYDKTEINTIKSDTDAQIEELKNNIGMDSGIIDIIYPVGSVYLSMNDANPSILFGGEWERLENNIIIGGGSTINDYYWNSTNKEIVLDYGESDGEEQEAQLSFHMWKRIR